MTQIPDRMRAHPTTRFQPPQLKIDLADAAAKLRMEPPPGHSGHRQETLCRHGKLTVALFVFDAGAQVPQHSAEGVVTIQVLEGRLKMSAEEQVHDLAAGSLLILAPGVKHDVHAEEPTRMLLTVCREVPKQIL